MTIRGALQERGAAISEIAVLHKRVLGPDIRMCFLNEVSRRLTALMLKNTPQELLQKYSNLNKIHRSVENLQAPLSWQDG